MAGALGVALLWALVRWRLRRADAALAAALLLGSSYAFWYYAVEVEVYTIAALFLIGCLWLLLRLLRAPSPSLAAALGGMQALAVLFHQTNLLLCVPALLALLLARGAGADSWRARGRLLLAYIGVLALLVGGCYLLVGVGVGGAASWRELLHWMTSYAHTGWWGGPLTAATWGNLAQGLGDTLAQPGGTAAGLLLVGLLLARAHQVWRGYPHEVLVLLAWLLVYGGFFAWWEADNIEFWIAALPPALLLLALALANTPRWHTGVWLALAVAASMAALNADAIVRRGDAARDTHREVMRMLARQSNPADLLLVSDGLQELYLPYYAARDYAWSLNTALSERDGDWPQACADVQAAIDAALARGAGVVVSAYVLAPPPRSTPLSDPVLERFGLEQADVSRCFDAYTPYLEPLERPAGLTDDAPRFFRLPSAQERAAGAGWDFARFGWGWQAHNVRDARFDGEGWSFVPRVDPHLVSPPMRLDATGYYSLEVRITASAATTHTAKYELFFVDEHGLIDRRHAVERTLERSPAGTRTTYSITLAGREGWEGIMTGLRLDPIGEGDGARVRVETLRLFPAPPE